MTNISSEYLFTINNFIELNNMIISKNETFELWLGFGLILILLTPFLYLMISAIDNYGRIPLIITIIIVIIGFLFLGFSFRFRTESQKYIQEFEDTKIHFATAVSNLSIDELRILYDSAFGFKLDKTVYDRKFNLLSEYLLKQHFKYDIKYGPAYLIEFQTVLQKEARNKTKKQSDFTPIFIPVYLR